MFSGWWSIVSGCDYATNIAQLNIYHLSPVVRTLGTLVPSELQEEPASPANLIFCAGVWVALRQEGKRRSPQSLNIGRRRSHEDCPRC
ncbi:hypothetical protein CKAN_02679200 [Cinnamomum micranthum f. kanehirae]|uniref:Uncharacterized protein n=1 Tax=Cinnamomum micranthum f. kanehirae TaxID=337451 RepID=A0A443Q2V2_9MAGN|nr:hypothetical protein CKAN_02679200 [Cinnamomum micranthum f. kanehirae]